MARRDRNDIAREQGYRNAYHRRVERSKAKAQESGEEFTLSKARGHSDPIEERQRRVSNGVRWTESTKAALQKSMLTTSNARNRIDEAEQMGLTLSELRSLIAMQNETFRAYHSGVDIQMVRAMAVEAGVMADDYGLEEEGWAHYH